ncbi:MAG: hypothetical protein WBP72_02330 [Rhodocyclaceae bacterium]
MDELIQWCEQAITTSFPKQQESSVERCCSPDGAEIQVNSDA